MTSSSPVRIPPAIPIPELGSSLGRIALPSDREAGSEHRFSLDAIRLDLATAIFDLAADARSWSSAGDRAAAVDSLGRPAWLVAWEDAVRAASDRVVLETDGRIMAAAAESRIPPRRRKRLLISDSERRAITARLGAGGVELGDGLESLEIASRRMRDAGVLDRESAERWRNALTTAARKLESAWLTLEQAADHEWERWTPLVESARSWRRPRWLLWTITALVLALMVYVGLVIGGYLNGPPFLERIAQWWWDWWDRLVEPI